MHFPRDFLLYKTLVVDVMDTNEIVTFSYYSLYLRASEEASFGFILYILNVNYMAIIFKYVYNFGKTISFDELLSYIENYITARYKYENSYSIRGKVGDKFKVSGCIVCNIGSFGKDSDSTIFRNSVLWEKLEKNNLNIPASTPSNTFPEIVIPLPFAFVGDGAFGLTHVIIYLDRDGFIYDDNLMINGLEDISDIENITTNSTNRNQNQYREALLNYFISNKGQLPWQMDKI
ncbi:hypothetical protein AGLY_015859 [Aphis glycines]|uniref:DDE Tnp4 domain-containing protein n=1 Tax=Aphis glycines TaxID=307491 RepID=A0A6G0SZP5_APHGL|nr:hypothetical protein AGLY_015859 [Aphis glycines]